jgi:hypothetical protein
VGLTPAEILVKELVAEWIQNPPTPDAIDYDDAGTPWVKLPAQSVSDLLLERHNLAFSVRRTRTALNGLVEKGQLLRTNRIGDHKWIGVYFYRMP